jgi:Nucleotidyltransferase of unknown function (DUF6036)
VNADDPLLDRKAIAEAFRRLGDRLARRGLTADVYVFGGAAMALAYDARRATRDIDAIFEPHGVVVEEAWAVANELGWPRWWLNEQASACRAGRRSGRSQGVRPPRAAGVGCLAGTPAGDECMIYAPMSSQIPR